MKAWGLTGTAAQTNAPLATSITLRSRAKVEQPAVSRANQLLMDMMLVNATKRKPTKK
jgi:hypothetical protein